MINLLISQSAEKDRHGEDIDVLEASLTKYFNALGITLLPVSNFLTDIDDFLEKVNFSGLIVSGSGDVNPASCLSKDGNPCPNYSPDRERTETLIIERMISLKLPILGICYGMQQINCHFGGTVTLGVHREESEERRPRKDHNIYFIKESFCISGTQTVNHYHNDGIRTKQLAGPLDAIAMDSGFDVVEALIHTELSIMGIQWHPERKSPDDELNNRLIKGLFKI